MPLERYQAFLLKGKVNHNLHMYMATFVNSTRGELETAGLITKQGLFRTCTQIFKTELEFGNVGFVKRRKLGIMHTQKSLKQQQAQLTKCKV